MLTAGYSDDLEFYRTTLSKAYPVVEFGSGTGRIALHLIRDGFTVYGIEKEQEYIHHLEAQLQKEQYHCAFHRSAATDLCERVQFILPFNFLFYLEFTEVAALLKSLKTNDFSAVIFDLDNLDTPILPQNLSEKRIKHKSFIGAESFQLHNDGKVRVEQKLFSGTELLSQNCFCLYLHQAEQVISLVESLFGTYELFGDFDLVAYRPFSNKLIVRIYPS